MNGNGAIKSTLWFGLLITASLGCAAPSSSSRGPQAASSSEAAVYATSTQARQAAMTADSALAELRRGNERFVAGRSFDRDYTAQVAQTSQGQFPFAAVVTCIDSRAAPEILFDQGIGDLFVGRVAGNVINDDLMGSLEFATKVAGAKVIVVLGHTECGAVKGACDGVELGKLTTLLDKIEPAIARSPTTARRATPRTRPSSNASPSSTSSRASTRS
jgi:carbonic anhydrase